jgi:OmpR family response regulator NblR
MAVLLLINTDETFTQKASEDLRDAGYALHFVPRLEQVRGAIAEFQPVLLIWDRGRTGAAGVKLCQKLRAEGYRQTIVMVVEQDTVTERAACLEAGADDYALKPYQPESFLQRLKFYLQLQSPASSKDSLQFGPLVLNLPTRSLRCAGEAVELTVKEFELLRYLMSQPGEVVSREQILENVWGENFQGESNIIEVYIRYLRLKLEQKGARRLIHTVRGAGYILKEG